jgi:REP element-mobilizing transposase RayT
MVRKFWLKIPDKFPRTILDEYVVMPNHLHGIIGIVGADPCVRPNLSMKAQRNKDSGPIFKYKKGTHKGVPLPSIIQWFKTMTSNEYIRNVRFSGWQPFESRFWQRGYCDHIIRDEEDLDAHRQYIIYNPIKWADNKMNPNKFDDS